MTAHSARVCRCWAIICRLWHIMHPPVTICRSRSRGNGLSACAERLGGPTLPPVLPLQPQPRVTPRTSAARTREKRLCHIDTDGVDHVPAVALWIARLGARLHAAERVARPCHDGVRAGDRRPRKLPGAPGIPGCRAAQRGGRPRLAAVERDVHAGDRAFSSPGVSPHCLSARRELRAVERTHDQGLAFERLERVRLLWILDPWGAVAPLHEGAVPLLVRQGQPPQPLDRRGADPPG